ncbi:MAG TPA: HRDC domain-containing protein, partial [Rhizomicrobium sp.]|nr:HRDC domain-containing protein [Rhizomicrobium sp.]
TRKQARQDVMAASTANADLLAALKELRLRLAKQRRVPAYAIFPDRTLIDMAERRPRSLDEFAEVNGVGAKKLAEFGAVFLKVLNAA